MKPPVAQPWAFKTSASVTRSGASLKPPLSRTPWAAGKRPVRSEQCAGRVSEVGGQDVARAVAADAVRPGRVQGDEDEVQTAGREAVGQGAEPATVSEAPPGEEPPRDERQGEEGEGGGTAPAPVAARGRRRGRRGGGSGRPPGGGLAGAGHRMILTCRGALRRLHQ